MLREYKTLDDRLGAVNKAWQVKIYFESNECAYYVRISKTEARRFLKEMHNDRVPIKVTSNLPMFNLFIDPVKS